MPNVNIPDVGVVAFPDSMTNDQIAFAIKNEILPKHKGAAKADSPAPESAHDQMMREGAAGPLEAVANMATGMVAKPVSDVAGLLAAAVSALTPKSFTALDKPQDIKEQVQRAMTYEPRTMSGKMTAEYNPVALISKGVDWVGGKAEGAIDNAFPGSEVAQAGGRGIREAINQAPMVLGAKGGGVVRGAGEALQGDSIVGAQRWMQSALKPDKASRDSGKAASVVDTLLSEGINVNKAGAETLRERVNALDQQVTDALAGSNATVNKGAAASGIQEVIHKYERAAATKSDLASIQAVYDDFLANPLLVGKQDMPVQLAQEMKQGIYRDLGDKAYGIGLRPAAERDARKALARGLKEEIVDAVPEVAIPNAEMSQLLPALNLVERRAAVAANNNIAGLGALIVHDPTAFAMWMMDRSSTFKSLVARMLNGTGKALDSRVASEVVAPALGVGVSEESPRQLPAPMRMLPAPSMTLRDLARMQ